MDKRDKFIVWTPIIYNIEQGASVWMRKTHKIINLSDLIKFYWTLTSTWNRSIDRRQGVSSDFRLGRTTKINK